MRILFAVLLAALLAALIWQRSRYKKLQKEINYISSRLENLPVASENGFVLLPTDHTCIKKLGTVLNNLLQDFYIKKSEFTQSQKADNLITTINDYFTMSKITSGDLPLLLQKENISGLCRDTILDYYDLLEKQQFDVDIQIPDAPVFAYTDKDALQRILKNLIDNTVRHGGEGRYLALRLTSANGTCMIEIEDHGKGMSLQQQKQIFTRNYTTAAKSSGSGLGLAISQQLAAQMGARLQVHSIPNEQTVFSIIMKS